MSKWIKYIICFLTMHLAMVMIYKYVHKRNNSSEKVKYKFDKPVAIDYLILGNSHVLAAVDSEKIKNSLMFAVGGEVPEMTYYKLKKILREGKIEFKYLILPFEFTSTTPVMAVKSHRPALYYNELTLSEYTDPVIKYSRLKEKIIYRLFPYKELPYEISKIRKRKSRKFAFMGLQGDSKKARAYFDNDLRCNLPFDNLYRTQFDFQYKLLELCKENNIKAVAVLFPIHADLWKVVEENNNNPFVSEYKTLMKKIKTDSVPVLDYTLFMSRFHGGIFTDYHHLNRIGSSYFTPEFIAGLDSIAEKEK